MSEIYFFTCSISKRIKRDSGIQETVDLLSLQNVCGKKISKNTLNLISFYLFKDTECRVKRKKLFGDRVVQIHDEYTPIQGGRILTTLVTFKSGPISTPIIIRLQDLEKISIISPFISNNILMNYSLEFDIVKFLFSIPIKDFFKDPRFIILFNLYHNYKFASFISTFNTEFLKLYNSIGVNYCVFNGIPIIKEVINHVPEENYTQEFESLENKLNSYSTALRGGKKKKSLSDCTVQELRSKMKKRNMKCSKDGKKLTKSQMIQKLRK